MSSGAATVTVTLLELRSLDALRPAGGGSGATLVRAGEPSPEFSRFLYTAVGGDWHWHDRLPWTWAEWMAVIGRPGYETWYATVQGTPAGYFELDLTALPDAVIAYFGLLPAFTGRGLGGWLLEQAVRRGFAAGAGRVLVETCTLDGPAALPNYRARGFDPVRTYEKPAPDGDPPGPWPGAGRAAGGDP
jgi:GNAT superfamily N-acetyltransferase